MTSQTIINYTPEELKAIFSEVIDQKLSLQHTTTPAIEEPVKKKQIAEMLDVSEQTVDLWKKQGKIPFFKSGQRVYFYKSEVLKSLEGK